MTISGNPRKDLNTMRQFSRITFRSIFRIKVSTRPDDRLIGYVGDLSDTGQRLLGDALLEVGSEMALRDMEGDKRHVDIEVVCLWSRENTKSGYFEAGVTLAKRSNEFLPVGLAGCVSRAAFAPEDVSSHVPTRGSCSAQRTENIYPDFFRYLIL